MLFVRYVVVFLTLIHIGACSVTPTKQILEVNAEFPQIKVLVENADVEKVLEQTGLRTRFVEYWQGHLNRDWKKRFSMELIEGELTEKFYTLYYQKAWVINKIDIYEIGQNESKVEIEMKITFVNPDGGEVSSVVTDSWVLLDNVWKHVIADPMLRSSKAPDNKS